MLHQRIEVPLERNRRALLTRCGVTVVEGKTTHASQEVAGDFSVSDLLLGLHVASQHGWAKSLFGECLCDFFTVEERIGDTVRLT